MIFIWILIGVILAGITAKRRMNLSFYIYDSWDTKDISILRRVPYLKYDKILYLCVTILYGYIYPYWQLLILSSVLWEIKNLVMPGYLYSFIGSDNGASWRNLCVAVLGITIGYFLKVLVN